MFSSSSSNRDFGTSASASTSASSSSSSFDNEYENEVMKIKEEIKSYDGLIVLRENNKGDVEFELERYYTLDLSDVPIPPMVLFENEVNRIIQNIYSIHRFMLFLLNNVHNKRFHRNCKLFATRTCIELIRQLYAFVLRMNLTYVERWTFRKNHIEEFGENNWYFFPTYEKECEFFEDALVNTVKFICIVMHQYRYFEKYAPDTNNLRLYLNFWANEDGHFQFEEAGNIQQEDKVEYENLFESLTKFDYIPGDERKEWLKQFKRINTNMYTGNELPRMLFTLKHQINATESALKQNLNNNASIDNAPKVSEEELFNTYEYARNNRKNNINDVLSIYEIEREFTNAFSRIKYFYLEAEFKYTDLLFWLIIPYLHRYLLDYDIGVHRLKDLSHLSQVFDDFSEKLCLYLDEESLDQTSKLYLQNNKQKYIEILHSKYKSITKSLLKTVEKETNDSVDKVKLMLQYYQYEVKSDAEHGAINDRWLSAKEGKMENIDKYKPPNYDIDAELRVLHKRYFVEILVEHLKECVKKSKDTDEWVKYAQDIAKKYGPKS